MRRDPARHSDRSVVNTTMPKSLAAAPCVGTTVPANSAGLSENFSTAPSTFTSPASNSVSSTSCPPTTTDLSHHCPTPVALIVYLPGRMFAIANDRSSLAVATIGTDDRRLLDALG